MKEQWKKLDSDAKLLVNVEEGRSLPIKIELPLSAFAQDKDDCCKRLLVTLRLCVLLALLVLTSWMAMTLYTNYRPGSVLVIDGETPNYINEDNKLPFRNKVYEKDEAEQQTTESVLENSHGLSAEVPSELTINERGPKDKSTISDSLVSEEDTKVSGNDVKVEKSLDDSEKNEAEHKDAADSILFDKLFFSVPDDLHRFIEDSDELPNVDFHKVIQASEELPDDDVQMLSQVFQTNHDLEEFLTGIVSAFGSNINDPMVLGKQADRESEEQMEQDETESKEALVDVTQKSQTSSANNNAAEDATSVSSDEQSQSNSQEHESQTSSSSDSTAEDDTSVNSDEKSQSNSHEHKILSSSADTSSTEDDNSGSSDEKSESSSQEKDSLVSSTNESTVENNHSISSDEKSQSNSQEHESQTSSSSDSTAEDDTSVNSDEKSQSNSHAHKSQASSADTSSTEDDNSGSSDEKSESSSQEKDSLVSSTNESTAENDHSVSSDEKSLSNSQETPILDKKDVVQESASQEEMSTQDSFSHETTSMENMSSEKILLGNAKSTTTSKPIRRIEQQDIFLLMARRLEALVGSYKDLLIWFYKNRNNPHVMIENDHLKVYTARLLFGTNIEDYTRDSLLVLTLVMNDEYNSDFVQLMDAQQEKMEPETFTQAYIVSRLSTKALMVKSFEDGKQSVEVLVLSIEELNRLELMLFGYDYNNIMSSEQDSKTSDETSEMSIVEGSLQVSSEEADDADSDESKNKNLKESPTTPIAYSKEEGDKVVQESEESKDDLEKQFESMMVKLLNSEDESEDDYDDDSIEEYQQKSPEMSTAKLEKLAEIQDSVIESTKKDEVVDEKTNVDKSEESGDKLEKQLESVIKEALNSEDESEEAVDMNDFLTFYGDEYDY